MVLCLIIQKEIVVVMYNNENNNCNYNNLWHHLLDIGMTKRELATKAHISESTLNNMKNGQGVSFRTLDKISKVVGLSINELIKCNDKLE